MTEPLHIRGGAGPYQAAAIAAVIERILQEEAAARAARPQGEARPPAWVRLGRSVLPGEFPGPEVETEGR